MLKPRLRSTALRALIVLWATVSVLTFIRYPGSKSFMPGSNMLLWRGLLPRLASIDFTSYSASLLWALLGIAIFSVAFLGIGCFLLARLAVSMRSEPASLIEKLAYLACAHIVGQGALSIVFLALACLGQLRPGYVVIALAVALGSGVYQIREDLRGQGSALPRLGLPASLDERWLLILGCIALALGLLYSSTRLSFDASAIYFVDAKLTALTHSVNYFIEDTFVASVFVVGINQAAIIQIFGDQAARLFSWVDGLAIIILGLALARSLGVSRRGRYILLAFILSSTAIFDLFGDGKIDLQSTAPALAAVYLLATNPDRAARRNVATGLLAGMAMAARPFNMLLLPVMLLLWELQRALRVHDSKASRRWQALLGSLLWMAVGALPWIVEILVSNWALLGDPLSFLHSYISLQSGAYPASFPADAVLAFRLLYPFAVTFINHGQSLGDVTPLFVGLIPLVLWRPVRARSKPSPDLRMMLWAALGTLLIWLTITSMTFEIRYVIFLWILLFMPLAMWADAAMAESDGLIRNVVYVSVFAMLVFTSLRTLYISLDTYSPVDRQGNAHCTVQETCAVLNSLNESAPAGSRVLMLNAFRYYLRGDLFACSTAHDEYTRLEELSRIDPTAFWTEAYREGNQFVAYHYDYVVGHLYLGMLPGPDNTPTWLHLEPLVGKPGDDLVVYRLAATDPPVPVAKTCLNNGDTWVVKAAGNGGE